VQVRRRDVDLDHADVGRRIGAQHLGRYGPAILEVDLDRGGVGEDVLVGEDVAHVS
jgi:hypothetical protein